MEEVQGIFLMSNKKFIFNADDFGMTKDFNRAVLYGYNNGFLKSASICANGEAFDNAINEVLPECPELSVGVHLNIIEGYSLTNCDIFTDRNGKFNNGYLALLAKSKSKEFLKQVEKEFRAQIEKTIKYAKPDHIDSHVHVHSIPNIFNIVVKLAKEYEIPFIRTQNEEMYFIPNILSHLNFKYPPNILKIFLLNYFTGINKKALEGTGLRTNDYIIGVGYTGLMSDLAVESGLATLPDEDCLAEALIHPCKYTTNKKNQHFKEFLITQNKTLEDKIKRLGFEITNYKSI